jgi:hypothetical protein
VVGEKMASQERTSWEEQSLVVPSSLDDPVLIILLNHRGGGWYISYKLAEREQQTKLRSFHRRRRSMAVAFNPTSFLKRTGVFYFCGSALPDRAVRQFPTGEEVTWMAMGLRS